VDGLLKYKKNQVYVLQVILRLLVVEEKYDIPIVNYIDKKLP
jgi:hypothetical protein